MKKVIIGFSKPKGFFKPFSWAIRLIEKTPYSHVFIKIHSDSIDEDLIYQASGVQVNFMGLQRFMDHVFVLDQFEVEMSDEVYRKFMKWAVVNAGADYSLKQVLGILLVKVFNLKVNPFSDGQKSWVCSELAGYFLKEFLLVTIDNKSLDTLGPKGIFEICLKCAKKI